LCNPKWIPNQKNFRKYDQISTGFDKNEQKIDSPEINLGRLDASDLHLLDKAEFGIIDLIFHASKINISANNLDFVDKISNLILEPTFI
jgi:hypothetical protein